jgi:hypothetical protein
MNPDAVKDAVPTRTTTPMLALYDRTGRLTINVEEISGEDDDEYDHRRTLITHIEFEAGVQIIHDDAFSGCTKLVSVVIPEGVTIVGHNAFAWCT